MVLVFRGAVSADCGYMSDAGLVPTRLFLSGKRKGLILCPYVLYF